MSSISDVFKAVEAGRTRQADSQAGNKLKKAQKKAAADSIQDARALIQEAQRRQQDGQASADRRAPSASGRRCCSRGGFNGGSWRTKKTASWEKISEGGSKIWPAIRQEGKKPKKPARNRPSNQPKNQRKNQTRKKFRPRSGVAKVP